MQTPAIKTFLSAAIKAQSKNITKSMVVALHTLNKVEEIFLYAIFIYSSFIGQLKQYFD